MTRWMMVLGCICGVSGSACGDGDSPAGAARDRLPLAGQGPADTRDSDIGSSEQNPDAPGQTGEEGGGSPPHCMLAGSFNVHDETPLGESAAEMLAQLEGPFESTLTWADGSTTGLVLTPLFDEYFDEREVFYVLQNDPRCEAQHLEASYGLRIETADGRLSEPAWGTMLLFGGGRARFSWSGEEMELKGTVDITSVDPEGAAGEAGDCIIETDANGMSQRSCSRGVVNLELHYDRNATTGELTVVPRWKNGSIPLASW